MDELMATAKCRGVDFPVDRMKVSGIRTIKWLKECQENDFSHIMELAERFFGEAFEPVVDAFCAEFGREPFPQEVYALVLEGFMSMADETAAEPKN